MYITSFLEIRRFICYTTNQPTHQPISHSTLWRSGQKAFDDLVSNSWSHAVVLVALSLCALEFRGCRSQHTFLCWSEVGQSRGSKCKWKGMWDTERRQTSVSCSEPFSRMTLMTSSSLWVPNSLSSVPFDAPSIWPWAPCLRRESKSNQLIDHCPSNRL